LPGDWVAYRDCSIHKQLRKDVIYEGRAKVLKVLTLTQGDNLNSPNTINLLPTQDVYLVTGGDEEGYKIKTTLEQILTIEEDIRPTEQYGPAFIKKNENSRLHQAQMFRSCINSIKENAWVRDYGVDLEKVCKLHLSTFAHSKIKGFMWLWSSRQQAQRQGCQHSMPTLWESRRH
jgi:hypothetical protein